VGVNVLRASSSRSPLALELADGEEMQAGVELGRSQSSPLCISL